MCQLMGITCPLTTDILPEAWLSVPGLGHPCIASYPPQSLIHLVVE